MLFEELIRRMDGDVPSKAEMLDELEIDGEEFVRAMVGAAQLSREANDFESIKNTNACIDWGVAIGYFYAAKKYREILDGVSR